MNELAEIRNVVKPPKPAPIFHCQLDDNSIVLEGQR